MCTIVDFVTIKLFEEVSEEYQKLGQSKYSLQFL